MKEKHPTIKSKLGFTLVEFVIVMTIGAILSGMIIPVGQKLITKAKEMKDISNVRQLALAYKIAFLNGNLHTTQALQHKYNILYLAWLLARTGEINSTQFYHSSLTTTNHQSIIDESERYLGTLTETDWLIALGIPPYANLSTTPIIVSRGLLQNGSWDNQPHSIYGKDGGIIAFLDGHVVWCRNCSEVLIDSVTKKPTTDYEKALPEGAQWCDIFEIHNQEIQFNEGQ